VSEVVHIGSGKGSYLMTVDFYRQPNGDIHAELQHMPVPVIEAEPTITDRFTRASMWLMEGALSFMRQAIRFDEETRAAMNDDRQPKGPS
jgi:hypothetical protein